MNLRDKYLTIPGWMLEDSDLSHTELIVYAAINGFCQDEISDYHGGLTYLCQLTRVQHRSSMQRILNRMVEKGCLQRWTEPLLNNQKEVHYRVSRKRTPLLAESEHPVSPKLTPPLAESEQDKKIEKKNNNSLSPQVPTHEEWFQLYGKPTKYDLSLSYWKGRDPITEKPYLTDEDKIRIMEHTRRYIVEEAPFPVFRPNPYNYLSNRLFEKPILTRPDYDPARIPQSHSNGASTTDTEESDRTLERLLRQRNGTTLQTDA